MNTTGLANTSNTSLILFDPSQTQSPKNSFNFDSETADILNAPPRPTLSEEEDLAQRHRQLRYLSEVQRLTSAGVSEEAARTMSLKEISRKVDRLSDFLHNMLDETAADASNFLGAHQAGLLGTSEMIDDSESKRETKPSKEERTKKRKPRQLTLDELRKRESKSAIDDYFRAQLEKGKNEPASTSGPKTIERLNQETQTKLAKGLTSNEFVKLNDNQQPYSFHHIAGAYLGRETKGLIEAANKRQDNDSKIGPEDLRNLKISELAKAFLVTAPKEFIESILSNLGIKHNETEVMESCDKLLNDNLRPLKESFKRLLDNKKNLNWDHIRKIFLNEINFKKGKDGAVKDRSLTTKGISQNFISRLKSTWENQGNLTSKPNLVAI